MVAFHAPLMSPAEQLALRRATGGAIQASSVQALLRLLRDYLGMDVAFVAEIAAGQRVITAVDAAPGETLVPGMSHPIGETYCQRIVDGGIPCVIPDALGIPELAQLDVTQALAIRAYIGTPIVFADGAVYGTLCSFSHDPDPTLNARDHRFLAIVAGAIAAEMESGIRVGECASRDLGAVEQVIEGTEPVCCALQPIVDLGTGRAIGYEALARFPSSRWVAPEGWFAAGRRVGRGVELELAAVDAALARLPSIAPEAYLAINVGSRLLSDARLPERLEATDPTRIVIELTEHAELVDSPASQECMARLRRLGVRIAIDDLGAGYSDLCRLLEVRPDIVKVDRRLVAGIDGDLARQALVTATVAMVGALGGVLVAEGIETPAERQVLQDLGVCFGQGFLLGRPA